MEADPEGGAALLVGGEGGRALHRLEEEGLDGQEDGHSEDGLGPEHVDVRPVFDRDVAKRCDFIAFLVCF